MMLHWGSLHSNVYLSLNWEGMFGGSDQIIPIEFRRTQTKFKPETCGHRIRFAHLESDLLIQRKQ